MTLSIKHKLLAGYGAIFLLLLMVAGVAYVSLSNIQLQISRMAQSSQPKVIASLNLASQIHQGSSALAYYMLSTQQQDKNTYLASLDDVQGSIVSLQVLVKDSRDQAAITDVNTIATLANKLNSYKETMFSLAGNNELNIPALKIASQELEPIGEKLLQLTTDIVLAESDSDDTQQTSQITHAAQELRFNWAMVMSNVRSYLAFRDETLMERMQLFKAGTAQTLQTLSNLEEVLGEDQLDALDEFIDLQQQYFIIFEKAYAIHSSEQWRKDAFLVRNELGPILNQVESALSTLVSEQQTAINRTTENLQFQAANTITLLTVMVVMAIAMAMVIVYFSAKNIIQPLRAAVMAMEDVAAVDGDLTKRLDQSSHDEIGQLGAAFNDFIIKILTLVRSISLVGEDVSRSTVKLSHVAQSTKTQVLNLQQQSGQVSEAVGAMATMVKEVAHNASSTASASNEAKQEAHNGCEIVSDTIEVINQLHGQFMNSAQQIKSLSNECDNISNVVAVIHEIADTTNLLSLNAAIEAARAGESGRGFAVVADEVRGLAKRTQASVEEIQHSIQRLMTDSKSAVQAMDLGGKQVDLCVEKAAVAGESLAKITDVVGTINEMNMQTAQAAEKQNSLFEEIIQATERISESTDDVSKEGSITAQEGTRLKMLADEMVKLVGHFKMGKAAIHK